MANDDPQKIKELLEIIKHKIDMIDVSRTAQSAQLAMVRDQLSMMNGKFDEMSETLKDPDTGLESINRRLDSNTAAVMKLESTIKGYGDMYKINDSNIRKIEKRTEVLENNADIEPSPEFILAEAA